MSAFVFDREDSPVVELANEVGIKPVTRSLEAERCGSPSKIPNPEFHARQSVDELRAFELFRHVSARGDASQLAGLWSKVMLFELKASFVKPAWFVDHRLKVDRAIFTDGEW